MLFFSKSFPPSDTNLSAWLNIKIVVAIKIKYPNSGEYLNKYKQHIKSINPETIKKAMVFRYKNKKKKLSTTDCVSYFMAQELGIKFLTGDKEFKNLNPNWLICHGIHNDKKIKKSAQPMAERFNFCTVS